MSALLGLGLIIAIIWLEVVMFGLVGEAIGVLPTIIGVFITAAVGLRLYHRAGQATMMRMAEAIEAGQTPIYDMADSIAIMLAAGLLLIPGYATDILGFCLFIPGLRVMLVIGLYRLLRGLAVNPSFRVYGGGFTHQNRGHTYGANPHHTAKNHPREQNHLDDDASSVIIDGDYQDYDKGSGKGSDHDSSQNRGKD